MAKIFTTIKHLEPMTKITEVTLDARQIYLDGVTQSGLDTETYSNYGVAFYTPLGVDGMRLLEQIAEGLNAEGDVVFDCFGDAFYNRVNELIQTEELSVTILAQHLLFAPCGFEIYGFDFPDDCGDYDFDTFRKFLHEEGYLLNCDKSEVTAAAVAANISHYIEMCDLWHEIV